MKKTFKVRLFLRILSSAITFISLSAGKELFSEYIRFPFLHFLNNMVPLYFVVLILFYVALDWNISKYVLRADFLIIKRFLRKQKSFALSEVVQIKEDKYFLFPGLNINLQGKKKPIRLNIDKPNEFIEFILNARTKNDEVIIDEKQKIIDFLPTKAFKTDA